MEPLGFPYCKGLNNDSFTAKLSANTAALKLHRLSAAAFRGSVISECAMFLSVR